MSAGSTSAGARAAIRGFILDKFPNAELADDQDIFTLGFVNSLFAMELVLFVERHFEMQVSNEELDIANFRSVDAMAALVERARLAA
jgi:methoxymalonate biosynthesis acyl carrier protein